MEITQFAYIPLMVIVDGEVKHINHAGLNHIGWSRGITGNWSIPHLAKITAFVPDSDTKIEVVITMTERMMKIMATSDDLDDNDTRYIAGIIMTTLEGDLSYYRTKLSNGFRYTVSRKTRILSKITETGVSYVSVE
jgi:hypothetical protein